MGVRLPVVLALSACALTTVACRDRATPSSNAGSTTSAATASASAAPSAAPAPLPAVRAFASGVAGVGVLLDGGRVIAKTQFGMRTASTTGEVSSFRSDSGSAYSWLERGRPMVWLAEKNGVPKPVCDVQTARDIVVERNRVCLVLDSGALGCTDAMAPECTAFTKPASTGPFARFLVARSGAWVVVDAGGKASNVAFSNGVPRVSPLPGAPTASDLVGLEQAWTKAGTDSFTGWVSATCLASKGAFACFDKTSGKPHPLRALPPGATAPGLLAKNALCFLLEGKLTCQALDTGVEEDDKHPFPGRALEKLPALPDRRIAADWGATGDGVAVLTSSNEVFMWQLDPRGKPPVDWSRVDMR